MPVNLTKGDSVNLTKEAPGLKSILAGAGWDVNDGVGEIDLDLMIFALDTNGKCRSADDAIFFNHKTGAAGKIVHSGDNRTGAGDGDDESISVDLTGLDAGVSKLAIVLHSYSGQDLSVVKNAFVRVVNKDGDTEIARYDITGGTSGKTLYLGELNRVDAGFEFKATGDVTGEELASVFAKYGL